MDLPLLPVALALCGFGSWIGASICVHTLINQVNLKLSPGEKISHFVASRNHFLIRQKYREAYPQGRLPLVILILTVDGAVFLAVAAFLLVSALR